MEHKTCDCSLGISNFDLKRVSNTFFVHTCVCVVADENMSLAHSDADAVDVATPPQSDGETSPHSESETDPEGNPSGENEVNIGKKLCKVSVQ